MVVCGGQGGDGGGQGGGGDSSGVWSRWRQWLASPHFVVVEVVMNVAPGFC